MHIFGLFLCILFLLPAAPVQAREMEDMQIAVLRTIDKVSARTHTFEVSVNQTVKFGDSLFIKVRACRKSTPLEQPESSAFLQIWERKADVEEATWVFSGWMFASSPSLSPMNHPVYDVWVIDCKNAATSPKPESVPATEAKPPAAPSEPSAPVKKPAPAPVPVPVPAPTQEEKTAPETEVPPADPASPVPPKVEDTPSSFEED